MTMRLFWIVGVILGWLAAQNVGIGTAIPSQPLHVSGNLRLDGAFMPGNNPGLPGQLLFSQGPNTPPIWQFRWRLWAWDAWNPSSTTSLGWTCTGCGGSSPWLTYCGSNLRMLGGFAVCGQGCYFEKTFTNLPPHTEAYIEVRYFAVDSWDQNSAFNVDHVRIAIDGLELIRCYPYEFGNTGPGYGGVHGGLWVGSGGTSICGAGEFQDLGPYICVAGMPHTNSNLTIRIASGVDQPAWDESLGILSVKLFLK